MRPISRLWVLLIVLSLVLGGLAGCGKKAPETIKIGIFSPTTGFAAADGTRWWRPSAALTAGPPGPPRPSSRRPASR